MQGWYSCGGYRDMTRAIATATNSQKNLMRQCLQDYGKIAGHAKEYNVCDMAISNKFRVDLVFVDIE